MGQSSSTHQATLTNTGDQPLSLNSVTLSGANAGDFTATTNCPPLLQPNNSCTVSVIFSPTVAGLRQAALTATDNAPGSPQSIPLTGTGVAPQPAVTLMPASVSFPTTAQGATSTSQTVTVVNSGAATLHIASVLLSGANPGDFNIVTNGCNGAYQVSATSVISVSFSPFGDGLRTASISIADDAPNSPQSVQLNGTGSGQPVTRPAVTVAPTAVSFGTITQGVTSGSQNVTLTSAGSAPLHISSVLLGGANPGDFTMNNGCNAAAYAVNATCTIHVTFAPLTAGQRAATIAITDDASGSPQTISLNGNVAPAFTVVPGASGSLSATVTAGQTAAYNLQVAPASDFVGSISFSCTGAPLAASCVVPQLLQINGNTVPFTVKRVDYQKRNDRPIFPRSAPYATPRPAHAPTAFAVRSCLAGLFDLRKPALECARQANTLQWLARRVDRDRSIGCGRLRWRQQRRPKCSDNSTDRNTARHVHDFRDANRHHSEWKTTRACAAGSAYPHGEIARSVVQSADAPSGRHHFLPTPAPQMQSRGSPPPASRSG